MKIGVIIGRFQAPGWHTGHRALLEKVTLENDRVAIGLGVARSVNQKNVLDFGLRKQIASQLTFGKADIFPLLDQESDKEWSLALDELLYQMYRGHEIRLYSGRDGFHTRYSGRHTVNILEEVPNVSASEDRKDSYAKYSELNPHIFAAGVIHGASLMKSRINLAVDVALLRSWGESKQILLGKKSGVEGWRLPGGMVESGETLEMAAWRELKEETSYDASSIVGFEYLLSHSVKDPRFPEGEKPLTALFAVNYLWGRIRAGDDLEKVHWFNLHALDYPVVEEHKPLLVFLRHRYGSRNS